MIGASGKIGRAIYVRLCAEHEVRGFDIAPSSTADIVAPLEDTAQLRTALEGVDAVIHSAALHAPHVGRVADSEFEATNVTATERLVGLCLEAGVKQIIYTSTTALYGHASTTQGRATWITEDVVPMPRTVYHRSKLRAEAALEAAANAGRLAVAVLRMSRCFPEPAPVMAAYRLHRGVDARDVAHAHALALATVRSGFHRYIVSGATPFDPSDAEELWRQAPAVIRRRLPELAEAFDRRGWQLPAAIDRIYASKKAQSELGWQPSFGYAEVLAELDRRSSEVLPLGKNGSASN